MGILLMLRYSELHYEPEKQSNIIFFLSSIETNHIQLRKTDKIECDSGISFTVIAVNQAYTTDLLISMVILIIRNAFCSISFLVSDVHALFNVIKFLSTD